jgi:hypothetical protein
MCIWWGGLRLMIRSWKHSAHSGNYYARDPDGAKGRVRLWELASFRNFNKSLHTQGIHVFRAPLTGNHHTLQGDAHVPGSGSNARSKEFVLLVTGERRRLGPSSRQHLLHHVPFDVRQPEIAAGRRDAKPD